MNIKNYVYRLVKAVLNKPQVRYKAEKNYIIKVSEQKELESKVSVVTGANGTLGRAICHILAANGSKVYLAGRNIDKLNALKSEFDDGVAEVTQFEITDEWAVKGAIDTIVHNEGHIDIWVNCAGGSARSKMAPLIDQSIEVIDQVLASNVRGTMICSKYAAKQMKGQKSGTIINIASTTGIQGNIGNCDYTTAKSGVIGFTKALAQELGEYSVRVNCVSPGFIQTGMFDEKRVEYLRNTNFLRKVGEPEDIANAVEYLASDRAKFITGINLVVDGGRILGLHTFNS